ncbi:hypothetical protein KDAU_31190 [Dictyobacter aurantiacus]|uniref:Uncharacterized protein n=1 Tax=Dictyobacter aurantiacus TaxID=1936993 RepID=A0A401ZFW9_9CHLR|nr:hypothetical protein KDAU_31190 [Dictyobacter aurantiacus]
MQEGGEALVPGCGRVCRGHAQVLHPFFPAYEREVQEGGEPSCRGVGCPHLYFFLSRRPQGGE